MDQPAPITWDKYALTINGTKKFLVGGEFHYWRLPDQSRWLKILETYKTAGLNFIRIYFHWGYHNPKEDVFFFEENRDVDYLLSLCEELGFYVFIASGPYICAETTAGGYPNWFAWHREVRVKHLKGTGRQKYDPNYMNYCRKWFENFIPQVKSHQITEKSTGCVIGYQIENEYIEKVAILKGSTRYMSELIQIVKDCGITVPTYHNDAFEWGSWNGLVDLYTFDKYPIVMQSPSTKNPIAPWKPANFKKAIDKLEATVAKFAPPASKSPMIIPELQGGWFNQWGTWYGFDELYDWYGPRFQKLIAESVTAQRVTLMNFYMFYGGTNWGSLFNPEVYTSYDYAACIREFGFQSERLRYLRLFALFSQSFETSLVQTDLCTDNGIIVEPAMVLNRVRKAADGTIFYFLRNLESKPIEFNINYPDGKMVPHVGKHTLLEQDSFIAIGNHRMNGFTIELCTLPIILKGLYADGELLVLEHSNGELILNGAEFKKEGAVTVNQEAKLTRYSFSKPGMAKIFSPQGKTLYLLCLSRTDLLTLNAEFSAKKLLIAWGAYGICFSNQNELKIETIDQQTVYLLSMNLKFPGFTTQEELIPGLQKGSFGKQSESMTTQLKNTIQLEKWQTKEIDILSSTADSLWIPISYEDRNPIDHHMTVGHTYYKCVFNPDSLSQLKLKLNVRHKGAVWFNGHCLGDQKAYAWGYIQAGAKNGPDPKFLGTKTYDLTPFLIPDSDNTLLILTESLGLNKTFWLLADLRNPRGILSAKFSKPPKTIQWYISGRDAAELNNPFNTASLPQEEEWRVGNGTNWTQIEGLPTPSPDPTLKIYKSAFTWQVPVGEHHPLLLHLDGQHNINIYLNGWYIGRYWGGVGPQKDFYLMDGLIKQGKNYIVLAIWTTTSDPLTVELRPYRINSQSGNLDEKNGIEFRTQEIILK